MLCFPNFSVAYILYLIAVSQKYMINVHFSQGLLWIVVDTDQKIKTDPKLSLFTLAID